MRACSDHRPRGPEAALISGESSVYDGFEVDGKGVKIPGVPEFGVNFRSCPVCGSTVWSAVTGISRVRISVGNFADPQFPAPLAENHTSMRQ